MENTILLVDDDNLIRKYVGLDLEENGYQVTTADSGEKAVYLLNNNVFDLVITDLIMDEIDGIQVLKKAKELNPETMVIILTGHGSMATAVAALRLDADDYMLKPIHPAELSYRVSRCFKQLMHRSELKRAEEELEKAKKLESVGILAGGVAHDFNNLLSIIMGNISMANDDVKPEHGISEFLDEAKKASLLARDLTKQLITFSKGGSPVKELSYISNLIEKATNFALSGSTVGCQFNMPDDLWPVEIDKGQIRHVINNVVINAVQAMPKGGTIEVCAENYMSDSDKDYEELSLQDGRYVKISIRDQGIGISDRDLPRIFDPYYSSKERGTLKGMGLGLATSYSIIKYHRGNITAKSKVGVETTIDIFLPASEIKLPRKERVEEKAITGNGKILVMDDEEMVRKITGRMLSRSGYKVEFSKNGADAIECYRESMKSEKPFDSVILDLTVRGGMGGKEAIQKLIEIDPDIKGIVTSGHSEDPVMNDFRKYGFCGAIAKPYSMPELSVILDKVITDTDVL